MATREQRLDQLRCIQSECAEIFARKNRDYGDAFACHGPVGVLVRIGDKLMRCQSITKNGTNLVRNESLRDTLLDLSNYAAMCVMLLDEDKDENGEE